MFGVMGTLIGWLSNNTGIRSIQRGTSAGAGNVTITAVDVGKTIVLSASKGSTGYVAARGNISLSPEGGYYTSRQSAGGVNAPNNNTVLPGYSGSITGGTTDLTVKVYSASLVDATTINCDGACGWQVIEYA